MMDPLEREARESDRRAKRFEERKPRILHAKTRLIGIDTQALDYQVAEKQDAMRAAMERDLYFENQANRYANIMVEQENIRQQDTRLRNQDVNQFRLQQQEERAQRDAAAAAAERADYSDDRTVFLKFRGVDAQFNERRRNQQAQQMEWCNQKIEQQLAEEQARFQEDVAYEDQQRQINSLRAEMETLAKIDRRQGNLSTYQQNQGLAMEKAAREARAADEQVALNKAELAYANSSDFLNENRTDDQRESFKGFTAAQKAAILEERSRQINALREKRARATAEQSTYDKSQEQIRRQLVIEERKKMAARNASAVELRKEHERQRTEKTARYDYLDSVVYTNPVQESYFSQFGTSVR
jgi:hypothetical protein